MTCIAAIIDDDGVGHIASDSLGSNGHSKDVYKDQKVFTNGKFLVEYTSSYRMGQLLQYRLSLPKQRIGQTIDEFMYIDFVDAVRSLLKENGYMMINSNREEVGSFLVVTEGRIWQMQDDLSLLESSDGFDACGSGAHHAQAAMHVLKRHSQLKLAPKEIPTIAIETASRYVATVGGEVRYISETIS